MLQWLLFFIAHVCRHLLVHAPSWVEAEEMGLLVLAAPWWCLESLGSLCGCSGGVKKRVTQGVLAGKALEGFHLQLAKWQVPFSYSGALWKSGPAVWCIRRESSRGSWWCMFSKHLYRACILITNITQFWSQLQQYPCGQELILLWKICCLLQGFLLVLSHLGEGDNQC